MRRVHVICEGYTEQIFVRELLWPKLPGLHLIPILPGKTFGRSRGGDIKYDRIKPDILAALKHDQNCCCTTFLDYYALGSFPEFDEPVGESPEDKASRIERAVENDIVKQLGDSFDRSRFYPYLSMHEFEALLFSNTKQLANGLYRPELAEDLEGVRRQFSTPEHINDDPKTAPSKQLIQICKEYNKVTGGNLAALEVGIDSMNNECNHFRKWFEWLSSRQVKKK